MRKLPAFFLLCATTALCGPIESLKPGEWYEVPNSHLSALDPCPTRDCAYSGAEGVAAVINDWSGGAFDTKRSRLIVWGGGHGGYAGNEVYVFSLDSLKWSRLTAPSNPPAVDVPYAADGGPCSRHTYNYIQYVPAIDRFCTFGGAGFYVTGQTGTAHTDAFNFDTKTWAPLADVPDRAYSIGVFSAVDPVSGHVWQHGCQGSAILAEYDPAQNKWIAHGGQWTESGWFSYYMTAAIDPVRHTFVAVGGGSQYYWKTDSLGDQAGKVLPTTGDTAMVAAASPGFEWDPALGKFVSWNGGADVYTLDMASRVWTKIPPVATNSITPTAHQQNGTFGRFRYAPAKDVFVAVNSVNENVFVYRAAGGSATAHAYTPRRISQATHVSIGVAGSVAAMTIPGIDKGDDHDPTFFDVTGKKMTIRYGAKHARAHQ
jgi:hypothetical protein